MSARPAARPGVVLALLCAAQFMLIVDVVVVNVALPSIRADLGIPDSRLQLVAVGYTLTFGSLLIVFGRAGDLLGRRRLLLMGLAVFTAASLVTGMATSAWQLVAARGLQGVGAAMVSPTALALLTATFAEGEARNRALGWWAAVGSGGAIAGQLLGGLLTQTFGWRSIFLVNVPVGVLAIVASRRHLPESRVSGTSHLDVRGALVLVVGLASLIGALTAFADRAEVTGVLATVVAVLLLSGFWRRSRRHPDPVVDPAVVRTAHVAHANALLAINAGMLGASLFFTTLYLQVVLGYSPLAVGVSFAPLTLVVLVLAPRIGARIDRWGARRLLATGSVLSASGMLLLARFPETGSYAADVLPALLLVAVGSAFGYAPTFVTGTSGVPVEAQGLASGLLNASQEIGAAIGITALVTVAAGVAGSDLLGGYRVALLSAAVVTAAGLAVIARLPRRSGPAPVDAAGRTVESAPATPTSAAA